MQNRNICKFVSAPLTENLSVSCFVLESNPEVMSRPHVLEEHRMILVTAGTGTFCFDHQKMTVTRGNLLFGFSKECFSAAPGEGFEYMYLRFSGTRGELLLHRFSIHSQNRFFSGFEGLIPLWVESLSRASAQTVDLVSESVLLYTFSRLIDSAGGRDSVLNRIIEITDANFKDPGLSLSVIAQRLSYNPKYLSHIFRKGMGIGFSEYLRSLRIKYAVSLLEYGLDSVKNVALLSGFTDPLYFSTVFKNSIGVSPREYQNSLSAKDPEGAEKS